MALEYERLTVTVERALCRIVLDDPESGNALGDTMRQELLQALLSAQSNDEVRVVLITGAGDTFCFGLPDGEIAGLRDEGRGYEKVRPLMDEGRRIISLIDEFPKPVVAALNGAARAEGAALALACDLRIARPDTTLALDFVSDQMAPAWGASATVARLAGEGTALDLLWTGRTIDAIQAQGLGLVERVSESFEAEVAALCDSLGSTDPNLLHLTRMAVQSSHACDLADSLDLETEIQFRNWSEGRRRTARE